MAQRIRDSVSAWKARKLPNYLVPAFDGGGAMEYVVDITHDVPGPDGRLVPAVHFLGTMDTPYVWELTIWYRTLNVGYRPRISGESDFPCVYGERVGIHPAALVAEGTVHQSAELEDAKAAYAHARQAYRKLMAECEVE